MHNPQQPDVDHLAELCLGYLAEDPEELLRFLESAGMDPPSFRQALGTTRLQRGLIDYVASNEPVMLAVCAGAGIKPEEFMRVWYKLNPAG